jgi:Uma2 family endonuclease
MGNPAIDKNVHWTYRHYLSWPDEERWELIDGKAWSMCAAPRQRHQELLWQLTGIFRDFLKGKSCKGFASPFDVILPKGDEDDMDVDTVVEPDLVVFCDRSKLTERGARGAPDLVIEILSPSTSKKDQHDKHALYERSGVREYWVFEPGNRWLCVYKLGPDGKFDEGDLREPLGNYEPFASTVLEGLVVDLKELFESMD